MSIKYSYILFVIALILQLFAAATVMTRAVSLISLAAWLVSIIFVTPVLIQHPFFRSQQKHQGKGIFTQKHIFLLCILAVLQIGILWYFGSIPSHYHQDEFITAYTSWTLPAISKIDWFAAYPDAWVSQFPILFHALQKPFFFILGPTVNAVRISVWPYAVGILFYLYVLTVSLYSRRTAIIVSIIFTIFAPQVYLSSMGLHFISSTFFYIAALTHFVLFIQTQQNGHAIAAGIFCGLAYLTYTSSYVTYFVLASIALITKRKGFVLTTIEALFVLAPFIVYASTVNNFFFQRIEQVNAIWGSWSDPAKQGIHPLIIVGKQTVDALRSIVQPGIGGLGGYNFGNLGLLEPITAALLLLGSILLWQATNKLQTWIILLATVIPFVTGFILTTHPPPFHRLAIIYPFLALIVGLGLARIRLPILIVIIAAINLFHANQMVKKDATLYPQNSRLIAESILQHVQPGQVIQIAAYPSFYLGEELLFRTNNQYAIQSDNTNIALSTYQGETLILLNPPKKIIEILEAMYPNHTIIQSIKGRSLGDLTLFLEKKE